MSGVVHLDSAAAGRSSAATRAAVAGHLEREAQVGAYVAAAEADERVRALVLSGEGPGFCAGNDLHDFLAGPDFSGAHPVMGFLKGLATLKKPLVAAVHGQTVGIGVTMLLHCDLVSAARNTQFSMPFVSLGLVPEAASSLLLPRLLGPQRAAELLPSDSSVHYQLSRTLRRAGRPDEAAKEAALSEQLGRKEKESQQVLANTNEGLSLVRQGHAQEGLAKIKEALQTDPANLTAHFNYALALRHLGRYDESIGQLQKVLQMQPDMPAAHYQIGCDYFKKGQYQEAVIAFRRAAGLIPGTAAVHNGLGLALAKSGDTSGATAELALARKLEPKNRLYEKNLECLQKPVPGCALVL